MRTPLSLSLSLSRVRTVERDSDSPSAPRAHKEEHGDGHGRNGKPPHRHTDGRLIPLTSKAPPQRVREYAQGVRGAARTQRGHAQWASVVPSGQRKKLIAVVKSILSNETTAFSIRSSLSV